MILNIIFIISIFIILDIIIIICANIYISIIIISIDLSLSIENRIIYISIRLISKKRSIIDDQF